MSFDHMIVALQMTLVGFILWKQVNHIEENVSGQWGIRFSRIERCIEICAVFARKSLEMLISLTF